jgi:hypothetical protein
MTPKTMTMHSLVILLGATGLQATTAAPEMVKQLYQHSSQSSTTIIRSGPSSGSSPNPVNVTNIVNQAINQALTQTRQQASLNLSAQDLDHPYQLNIRHNSNRLRGIVQVNGETIHTLGTTNSINLSPYLSTGQHTVEIVGSPGSASTTVQISLTGPGTQLSYQISGQGQLRYTLQISVQ